ALLSEPKLRTQAAKRVQAWDSTYCGQRRGFYTGPFVQPRLPWIRLDKKDVFRGLTTELGGTGRAALPQMEGRERMDIRQVLDVLPHRYPFLLVDRVLELEPGRRAVGVKNVTINEPFFQGHFPGYPV